MARLALLLLDLETQDSTAYPPTQHTHQRNEQAKEIKGNPLMANSKIVCKRDRRTTSNRINKLEQKRNGPQTRQKEKEGHKKGCRYELFININNEKPSAHPKVKKKEIKQRKKEETRLERTRRSSSGVARGSEMSFAPGAGVVPLRLRAQS